MSDFLRPGLVSVILPAYNLADLIGLQLNALQAQSYPGSWELLVVDNGSSDGTAAVVQRFQAQMPNLRLMRADAGRGSYYARHVGAQAARGDLLVFCDGDDIADRGWLEGMVRASIGNDFVVGTIDNIRLNTNAPWRPNPSGGARQPALNFLPYAISASLAVSRQAYQAVGGYDPSLHSGGDIDLSWRLQLNGYRLVDAPDAVMYYRYRQTTDGFWRQIATYAEAHVMLYRRYARHGMPPSSLRLVLRRVGWLVRNLPHLFGRDRRRRSAWLYQAATRWGRLRGSLHYRTFYL